MSPKWQFMAYLCVTKQTCTQSAGPKAPRISCKILRRKVSLRWCHIHNRGRFLASKLPSCFDSSFMVIKWPWVDELVLRGAPVSSQRPCMDFTPKPQRPIPKEWVAHVLINTFILANHTVIWPRTQTQDKEEEKVATNVGEEQGSLLQ